MLKMDLKKYSDQVRGYKSLGCRESKIYIQLVNYSFKNILMVLKKCKLFDNPKWFQDS